MSKYLTLCLPSSRLVRNTGKGKYQRLYHTNTSLNQINNMNLKNGKKPERTPNTVLDTALLGHFSCDRQSEGIRRKQNKNTDLGTGVGVGTKVTHLTL